MAQSGPPISAETLRSFADQKPPRRPKSGFSVLLGCSSLLRDWHDQGYTLAEMHGLLVQSGMVISLGTVRAYVARILKADAKLTQKLGRAPTLAELRAACSARRPAKASPAYPASAEVRRKLPTTRHKSVLPFDPDTL